MVKHSKEFNLGNIPARKIYDLLVEILLECVKDPEVRDWLNMSLESSSIFSEAPFLGQIRAFAGSQNTAELTCVVTSESNNTKLNIQSVARYPQLGWGYRYGYYYRPRHKRYIAALSNELFFRLNNPDIISLDQTLRVDEKLIYPLMPVYYNELRMICSLSNSRILFSRCKKVSQTIEYSQIQAISRGKIQTESQRRFQKIFLYAGFTTLSLFILFLILQFSNLYNFAGLLFVLGFHTLIALPIGLSGSYHGYLSIQTQKETFNFRLDGPRYPEFLETLNQLLQNSKGPGTPLGMSDLGKNIGSLPSPTELITEGIYCQCGAKLPPKSLFCHKCGASQ